MTPDRKRPKPADYFTDWKQREALAEAMIPIVGRLYREKNVKVYVYGRSLVSQSVLDIMKTHRFVRQVEHNELSEFETWPLVEALGRLELGTGHVDIGRLSVAYAAGPRAAGVSAEAFLRKELQGLIGSTAKPVAAPRDVVLYGFGRIGRLLARLLIEKTGGGDVLRLRAVVVRKASDDDLVKRAALLRRDSVHGSFDGTIRVDEENGSFIANGNEIKLIYADAPESIDYTAYGINDAIVIDNTGKWRDEEGLSRHLQAKGVSKVILTAPGKGALKNIVHGVNHDDISADDRIISAASCTTNAIVPVLKAVDDQFGIVSRPRRDRARVHQRPEPDRQLPQGRPPRPQRAAEHGDHRDRRRQRRGQGAALDGGQAHRQRDPRADAGRLDGDPQPHAEAPDHGRGSQRVHALGLAALAAQPPDRLHRLAGSGVLRLRRLARRLHRRRAGHDRAGQQRDPLPLVRQRVRLRLPGAPRARARGRRALRRVPGGDDGGAGTGRAPSSRC